METGRLERERHHQRVEIAVADRIGTGAIAGTLRRSESRHAVDLRSECSLPGIGDNVRTAEGAAAEVTGVGQVTRPAALPAAIRTEAPASHPFPQRLPHPLDA